MSAGSVMIVDDEPQIRRVLRATLLARDYEVMEARTAEEALDLLTDHRFDLILLDMNMPGMGGLEGCREIRAHSDAAIVMLTVRDAEADKVAALDAGADDYVTKPFSTPELLARIRAALRRTMSEAEPAQLRLTDVTIDFAARAVQRDGVSTRLTPTEFDLLRYLVGHPNKALTHRELLSAVWGPEYGDEHEYLRVFVNQLRRKIEPAPSQPRYIITEPWVGYRFALPDKAAAQS
ncbi:MAG TPA: response regulator transcription factor [Bryobacteraceae bacterium]|nr:response regulator transcription factor [Bryobacteraceae bacterium]